MSYARPYRLQLAVFLVATCLDSVITVANPLLPRQIIDKGILPRSDGIVIGLAIVVAGVALFDAFLGVAIRWFSARLTQSLIYDLRTQVFRHVSRQPIASSSERRRVRWCPG
jgi:ATP-binding cassette subfamily B protein